MSKYYGLLAILAAATVAGCGSGAGAGTPGGPQAQIGGASGTELAERQVLHVGNGAELQSLDPHRAEDVPSSNVHRDIYEGLVNEAPNGDLDPGRRVVLDHRARTARPTCSTCGPRRAGRTAIPSRRTTSCSRCAAASIRRPSASTATS